MAEAPTLADLLRSAQSTADHLEMRDGYMRDSPSFIAWQNGSRGMPDAPGSQEWRQLVRETVSRGVSMRRARIVSEPLSDYTRFEYDITREHNIGAGEEVRWLPRSQASRLALPGNDFWLFDGQILRFGLFAGDGSLVGHVVDEDPDALKLAAGAFEAVWRLATPHEDYQPA
ncbi:MAG: hypothetical protein HOY79_28845 [Streptomyces sp.]|nr:hypothetical protein [Streptomyces sp.]